LCSLVSWRIFAFLRTQPEGANRAPVAPTSSTPPAGTAASNSSPAGTTSQDEASTQAAMRLRRRNLGIDYRFLADLVDEIFYAKHPEWQGKTLTASTAQGTMRQEWLALSSTTLDKLETLAPELRRKLGSYKPGEYQTWLLALGETGQSSPTLDGLADQRFGELFPDLKGKPLNPNTTGQVWYALAEAQLPQAKRQKSPANP
jgi:serine/threonine protein kinase, bacterial